MGLSSQSKQLIYDEIRRKWVAATPEEKVRQHLLKKMVETQSYPKDLIAVEKTIAEMPHLSCRSLPMRRLDVVCFAKGIHEKFPLYPLLLIECKETEEQSKTAMEQALGYNHYLRAPFIAVAYTEGISLAVLNKGREHAYISYLPSYPELLQALQR